jgi:hypothetical protein
MTSSSKPAGVTVAMAFFMVLSAICGAGWYQAQNRAVELSEQRIRELEQAKSIDQRLTQEIERLKIALKAGSRVALYREADA